MSEFKTIETQEELDAIIKDRLAREREKFADYEELRKSNLSYIATIDDLNKKNKELTDKVGGFDQTIADMTSKIKRYETDSAKTRIALETGLPYEFAMRLSGETEDEIRKDAESLVKYVRHEAAPASNPEPEVYKKDSKEDALRKMAKELSSQLGG